MARHSRRGSGTAVAILFLAAVLLLAGQSPAQTHGSGAASIGPRAIGIRSFHDGPTVEVSLQATA